MNINYELIIAIVSALIALFSGLFAWQAVKTANKTYSVELISQLYSIYQSGNLVNDLQITWGVYHKIWERDSGSKIEGNEKANQGVPINYSSAEEFVSDLERNSPEYVAIHNAIYFWTFLNQLMIKKSLSIQEIIAFTSPRILGFLYPIEIAIANKLGITYEYKTSLHHAYDTIKDKNMF